MEYAETRDILYVIEVLGRRNVKERSYPYVVGQCRDGTDICMIAKTVELIEADIMYAESNCIRFLGSVGRVSDFIQTMVGPLGFEPGRHGDIPRKIPPFFYFPSI